MNKRTLYNQNDLGNVFGLAVAVMLVGSFVLSFIFLPFARPDGSMPDAAFWIMQAVYTLVIGGTAFLYAAISKVDVLNATSLNRPPKFAHVGWGCLATLFLISLMLPVNEWLMRLIVSFGLPEPSVDLPFDIVPLILVSCVMAAVTEEIVFRGTVARSLEASNNKLAALAISGALFSLFHVNPAQTVHQFVLGAFLALLVYRSGSVWTTVLVHFFNNIVAVLMSLTSVTDAFFADYWYVFLPIGLVGFVCSVYGYLKTTDSCWNVGASVNQENEPANELQQTDQVANTRHSKLFLAIGVAVCLVMWICSLMGWI